jgi:hypothetical protein
MNNFIEDGQMNVAAMISAHILLFVFTLKYSFGNKNRSFKKKQNKSIEIEVIDLSFLF